MRKIKNYFIIAFIFVVSIILIIYLTKWYNTIQTYNTSKTVMKTIISEIKPEDLNNYIVENPNTVLYVTSGSAENVKEFEKIFKKYIQKENIRKEIIFIDIDETNNNSLISILKGNLSEELKHKNVNLSIVPNLYIIREGNIIESLYKVDTAITKGDVIQFLETYEVAEP